MYGIELMKSRAAALAHPGTVLLPGVLLLAVVLALAGCKGEDEFSSEGTAGSPIALTYPVNARDSQVGPESPSYYSVSGLTGETSYIVSISQLEEDADLFVFNNSDFTNTFCASGNTGSSNESCTDTTATGQTDIYIQVKPGITENGTDFFLSVQ